MFRCRQWAAKGWRATADVLAARGLSAIATRGPAPAERGYFDQVWGGAKVTRLDDQLD